MTEVDRIEGGMVNTCPYCGEEHRALKNHVRLTSGSGHGPSGQYPEDFPDAPDQDEQPSPGGGLDVAPARDDATDHDDLPDDPPESAGGGGAVAVEAVADAETEEQSEPDETAEEDDSLIAMPESELNTMLQEAAKSRVSDSDETEPADADEDDSVVEPEDVAERAEEEGWSLAVVLLVFLLAGLAGIAWGAITDKTKNGREQAQQLTSEGGHPVRGV